MIRNKSYAGLDYFRIIAALLIIAIHTSPLLSYSKMADFVLTSIIARIAVPFFFMLSDFFLISTYNYNCNKLKSFLKNVLFIYGIAIVIYIPLNIYTGYFSMNNLVPNIIKDIVFDGTLYHLWYLPASIIGASIAYFLVKKLGLKYSLVITIVIYVIGMFGDSYYGFLEKIPLLKNLYGYIFEVSDYTRNGIFFAPVFFILGGIISNKSNYMSTKNSLIGFLISFLLMLCEGMFLHKLGVQRHDSMYIMLLPCMYFLFTALTFLKGSRARLLRTSSLIIYIIHPMMIVVIRMFSKIFGIQTVLVDNSLIHYIVVSIASFIASIIIILILKPLKKDLKGEHKVNTNRAWIEIDLNNLEHNVKMIQKAMPEDCELMAVVKANAYGHSAFEVATCANQIGVKAFAVATIDEGIDLRRYGILGEILILGYTNPIRAKELHKYNLTQSVIDLNHAISLNKQKYNIKSHIKIDTGMHRLGFDVNDVRSILKAFKLKYLDICGIFTHLCVSDSLKDEDVDFTNKQIECFYKLIDFLLKKGIKIPKVHIQSSYGFFNYPNLKCNYVRIGIALYGILSSPNDTTKLQLDLRPVLSLKSQVILIRKIQKDDSFGYGRVFIASRDSVIAILSIGYADGIPRNLSCGKSYVIINGCRAAIVGRICMDQLAVDITDIPNVEVGNTAIIIGRDNLSELSASEVANNSCSISNELLSRVGRRLNVIKK